MPPKQAQLLAEALALLASVPGYHAVAAQLTRARIRYKPGLTDRATVSLNGTITLGPEPFAGDGQSALVSLAGTLVHEEWHARQHPLLKTASFWHGVFTRSHPMKRYERPAYQAQADFLQALATTRLELARFALQERAAALQSFAVLYL